MNIWLNILKRGAAGQIEDARRLLAEELPLSLRQYGSKTYLGPLPKAISRFVAVLPSREQNLARSYDRELADYIVDDVVESVRECLTLVELCVGSRSLSIDELARRLPWKKGLKRSEEWKRGRIADLLRSMVDADVGLPAETIAALADCGRAVYAFDEVAYAVAPRRLALSWEDFKDEQGLDENFRCIADESDASAASEGADYGSISIARVVLTLASKPELESTFDLCVIGEAISPELTVLMECMHNAQPHDGYRPIAWHNVFWEVASKYEELFLSLEQRDPFCETLETLASHITVNYCEVIASSRPSITRRRTRLYDACEEVVQSRIREYLAA